MSIGTQVNGFNFFCFLPLQTLKNPHLKLDDLDKPVFENASYSTQMQYNDVLKNIFDDDPVSMRIVVTVGQNETFDPSLTMVFDDVHVFQSEFETLITSGRLFSVDLFVST